MGLFPDNVIGSGGQVSAILDLKSHGSRMAFDLAMACVGFGWDGTVPAWERWKDLFDGYQSIRGSPRRRWILSHSYTVLRPFP